jgi:hypothetical protein
VRRRVVHAVSAGGVIGWYVHHQGRGHVTRATTIAAHLGSSVAGLSSLPSPGAPFSDWVRLPADDSGPAPADPTAGGALHWAPRRDAGSARRVAAVADWIAAAQPRALVVDVSVEAALLARLAGVPVIVVALPGDRGDDAHQLGYRVADRILAFWPREVYDPGWLRRWQDKTHWLGAVSRYDDRPPGTGGGGVVALSGMGGDEGAARPAATGWHVLAGDSWQAEPWPILAGADVVVTHAGQNALAEVAAARRPAVVVPAQRPFGEQTASADALARAGIAVVERTWPAPERWPQVLDRARALGGNGWRRWSTGSAAEAAARVIEDVARTGGAW